MTSTEQTKTLKGTTANKRVYTCPVIEFEGELAVEFPDELLDELGWGEGDELVWEQVMKDRYTLKLVRKRNE